MNEKCFSLAHHYTFLQKGRKLFCSRYNPKEKGEHCIIVTWFGKRCCRAQAGTGCIVTGFTDECTLTEELLLSAVKSMAIEMPSRKKLTLLYLSGNICWMPNSVAENTQKTSYNIKSKPDSVLLCGWRSPQILVLSLVYLNMRNISLERLLRFVLMIFLCRI